MGDLLIHLDGLDGADGKQVEVGWVFHPDVQGRGYATEAARELLRVGFEEVGVHRVWAQLDAENTASARICERLGMRREAFYEKASWFKEQWTDLAVFGIRADEWRAARAQPHQP